MTAGFMRSCKNCKHGDDPLDYCGIDGKNIKDQGWQPCDRWDGDPGCDIEEMDEYDMILMCQDADLIGAYIELTYNEDCI